MKQRVKEELNTALIYDWAEEQTSQIQEIYPQDGVSARGEGDFPWVEDVLEKAALIVSIIKALFADLPKAKLNWLYVLTHLGRFAQALLALFAVFMDELTNKSLPEAKAMIQATKESLEAQKQAASAGAPEDAVNYLQKAIQVATLLIDFITSTNWKTKLDFFFFLLNAGKISDLVTDIIAVFKTK